MSDYPFETGNGPGLRHGLGRGSRIASYRIVDELGRGGMAVVYRAEDERLGRPVALKLLSPGLTADTGFRQRFIRESRAAAAVDDPHIIPVYEADEADGVLFIAMRFVSGGDVHNLIRRHGPLTASRAAAITSPVGSALDAAHSRGLVHRDVKPANMLLDARAGRPAHVYLSDFGLSKWTLSATGLTASGQFLGTPDYVSPEQVAGGLTDGRTDQYALACALFEMLTGTPPFVRESGLAVIYAHASESPPALSASRPDLAAASGVLARALAKNPADRYPTCQSFAEAFRAAAGLPGYDADEPGSEPHPATVANIRASRPGQGTVRPGSLDQADQAVPPWSPAISPDPPPTHSGRLAVAPASAGLDQPAAPQHVRKPRRRLVIMASALVAALAAAAVLFPRVIAQNPGGSAAHGGAPAAAGPLSPGHDQIAGGIYSLAAGSHGGAWASGFRCAANCGSMQQDDTALILRWAGGAWRRTRVPAGNETFIDDIAAGPGGTAWAVGDTCLRSCAVSSDTANQRPVLLRWSGTSWSRQRIPAAGQGFLGSVTTQSDGTAWAVGTVAGRGLALHYSGHRWTKTYIRSPRLSNGTSLIGVAAGPNDTAWAVGSQCLAHCTDLVLHWDGAAWSTVPVPDNRPDGGLDDVSTGAAGQVWASGYSCDTSSSSRYACVPQIARWNGHAWLQTKVPRLPGGSIPAVVPSAAHSAFALAVTCIARSGCNSAPDYKTILLHWNGRTWSDFPYPRAPAAMLYDVVAGSSGTLLATGTTCSSQCSYEPQSAGHAVILRWNGRAWSS